MKWPWRSGTPSTVALASPTEAPGRTSSARGDVVYRLRFLNFNTNRHRALRRLWELRGHDGSCLVQDTLESSFDKDGEGATLDAAFITLTETRVKLRDAEELGDAWRRAPPPSSLDTICASSSAVAWRRPWRGCCCCFGLMARFTGNVKTLTGFRSASLRRDLAHESLVGRLSWNPEKTFIGTHLVGTADGLRISFFGTHFPMQELARLMRSESEERVVEKAKQELARFLRQLLSDASREGFVDERSLIIVQGDLNSRTMFEDTEPKDLLLEILSDGALQKALRSSLSLPEGRWHEVVPIEKFEELPVTYKFATSGTCSPQRSDSSQSPTVTLGDIVGDGSAARRDWRPEGGGSRYEEALDRVGKERLEELGVDYQRSRSKSLHFPACTDRVIYWAPDALAARLKWDLPRRAYEVLGVDGRSDHRPIGVEVKLTVLWD